MLALPLLMASLAVEADTAQSINIEEAVIVASPKETALLRQQALSVSLFDATSLELRGVHSLKDLSSLAPGLYLPEYGSRITSAAYVRGIGSRTGAPAVGLYVDNIPYFDKSAYDFSFDGIVRADVLRGPQGTLYGAGAMGGLVRLFTADPITHSGTEVSAGFTTRTAGRRASLTTYLHPADNMGLSLSGYYTGENGFYRNLTTGKKQDGSEAGGLRTRWAWNVSPAVRVDLTASYERSNEDACPYFHLGTYKADGNYQPNEQAAITLNRPSNYRRDLANVGLSVEHRLPHFVLTSITSYQHLADRLRMDQDFSAADIFALEQKQFLHSVTEEIALRSPNPKSRWQWTTGAIGNYRHLRTLCPVTFYGDGMDMLNNQIGSVLPANMGMSLKLTDSELPFKARLNTPSVQGAIYHQSTVRLVGGLSLTLGARLDYEHHELNITSGTPEAVNYNFAMRMLAGSYPNGKDLTAQPTVNGNIKNDEWQVLPKGALTYELPRGLGNVYFSAAKGYRSGGYNIQSYADLSQAALQRAIMLGVKDFSIETINAMPLPDNVKDKAIAGLNSSLDPHIPATPDIHNLYYKPEYTWSYELGLHHNLTGKTLQLDLAVFYMKTRDQQLSRFAESGLGRVMVNAGRSRSRGIEASLRSSLLADQLTLTASYGLTDATFTNYNLGQSSNGETTDYTGNRVPFVPKHTFSAAADFRQPLQTDWLKDFSIGADVKGAGSVMWDEANTFSQDLYASLGAHIGLELANGLGISVWGRNLTASRYATFSFDNMNQRYAQYAQPRHFGVDVKWRF